MRKIRFILAGISALGLLSVLGITALAQPPAPPERPGMGGMDPARMIDNRMTYYIRELNLTAEQQKKVRAILEEGAKTARGDSTASRRDRLVANRDQQKRRDAIDAKIKKVLTPDQTKKFDSLPRFGRGRFGGTTGVDVRLDFLDKQLNLTAEQKKKLKPILEKSNENMRSIGAKRQEGQDPSAFRDEFRKENERSEKEIETVLTPEQAKKHRAALEEMRQQMRNRQGQDQGRGQDQGGNR